MHGTYRLQAEQGAIYRAVHYRTPQKRRVPWASTLGLTTSLAVGIGVALVPANSFGIRGRPGPPAQVSANQAVASVRHSQAPTVVATSPEIRLTPQPLVAPDLLVPSEPRVAPTALVLKPHAFAPTVEQLAPYAAQSMVPAEEPRLVDIAQVADVSARSLHVPQLLEPGLVAGSPDMLVAKVDAMQVPVPGPLELSGEERATLLAEAPSEITVRVGEQAIGKVAFRMTDARTIDVQLSGLLDVVAERMAPEEYSRLRNSPAAASFVPLDELRAIGLSLRYDPVYDELDLSA